MADDTKNAVEDEAPVSGSPFADAAADPAEPEETDAEKEARLKVEHFDDWRKRFGDAAPDEQRMNDWKEQAGRVRWLDLGEDELYIFRPFRTAEYRGWMEQLQDVAKQSPELADERLRMRVLQACVLFPRLEAESEAAMFGGTPETLYYQIRLASNFIPPDQATMMVREW